MAQVHPYIGFAGNAREAMEYYHTVFGGELVIETFEALPVPGMTDAELGLIMHAELATPSGFTMMGADVPPGMLRDEGSRVTILLSGPAADEPALHGYWAALTSDGEVTLPLAPTPWGTEFGGLVDAYGVHWLISIEPAAGANRTPSVF